MKNIILFASFLTSATLNAQNYYNDIIGTQEINNKMRAYISAKVQSVTATGYDAMGRKAPDFNEWQEVQAHGSVLKITTRNGQSVSRIYYQFDNKTRLINARDSATDIQTITVYSYNANGNLVNIKSTTKDPLHDFDQVTERQWKFINEDKPETMLQIINGNDSTEYHFTLDENKNIADEMLFHRGSGEKGATYLYEPNKIYYFYDDKHRLTDITKYNTRAKQLLPDYMFEYDDNNRVIQKITVLSTVRFLTRVPDYLIWRYGYNDKGLKTKEVLYSKAKELKGKIEYSYTFTQ